MIGARANLAQLPFWREPMKKLAISLLALGLMQAGAARAQDITIALVGPITGANAAFGEQMQHGAEAAVKAINAKGGVMGKKFNLLVGDDACDPKQAVSVANQMAGKKVVAIIGHFCSGSSIPASNVYAEEGILQITPASTNPQFTERGLTNVFRTCGRDDQQGKVGAEYIAKNFKGKPVAVVDDKSAYGKGLADEARKNLKALGVAVTLDEQINAGEKDFSALVAKMKQANVAVVYFGGYQVEAGLITRQARSAGLQAQIMAGDALATKEFWQIAGPAGEGFIFTNGPDTRTLPSAKDAVAEFRKGGYEPEGYTLYTYAAVQALAQAIEKSKSTKLADLTKALHANKFDTVNGQIGFDQKGDLVGAGYVFFKWHDGDYKQM
jgi:branched-chain amino acid transport system substrate-binding protein